MRHAHTLIGGINQLFIQKIRTLVLQSMKKAAKTIKEHIDNTCTVYAVRGIITQIGTKISNGRAEQTNSKIAKIQRVAQGFRSFDNLRTAILFFNGSLRLFHTINE